MSTVSDYWFQLSLRLRHPSWDLSEAAGPFGLSPARVWRAGDARASSNGTPLAGVNRESYWTAPLAKGGSQGPDLPAAISAAMDRLWPHRQVLLNCCESGGSAEVFIGWSFLTGNSGDLFDWRLLERLSQMRMGLSFDIYDIEPT